ncbi:nuclear transport factor 2 family protein [Mycolicibacterium pyrenivorans]|uniref:nuclear transport factor 2 family protein n=1 Tax=Mycolicibacterium pyrenivorans TaxID=187102 RepID=UPI0021F2AD6D|nr:nuclear transport factor 2 family protein [Mycolicibacterium pyrenivorans]MCV7152897.1 nuclear transport factor 2 family protein [Mycolicibacterium pyrenivorans]
MESWELTLHESVRQTLADYTAATDAFDLALLASCFIADGTLEYTSGAKPLVGRVQIEAGLRAQLSGLGSGPTPTYVRHHVSSVRISQVELDRVESSSYFIVFTDVGCDHWGRYRDVLVPVDGKCLFASRKIKVDGFSDKSLMNPESSNAR